MRLQAAAQTKAGLSFMFFRWAVDRNARA